MTQTPAEFMQAYESVLNTHDLEATLTLIEGDAVFFFSNQTAHVGKQAIGEAIGRNFQLIEDETFTLANLSWLAQTEKVAVCVYDFSWSGMIRGEPASGTGRGTTLLRRSEDGWKVLHEHLSQGKFAD